MADYSKVKLFSASNREPIQSQSLVFLDGEHFSLPDQNGSTFIKTTALNIASTVMHGK